ncbi:MAG TPA: type II secretion system protein [Candidatus Hypogeohydataceae bacterium YC38]
MKHLTRRMAVTSARGFTLIELIMVIAIAGILTSTLMSPFFTGVKQGTRPEIYATALYLAEEEIETRRSTGYASATNGTSTSSVTVPTGGTRTYSKTVVTEYVTYASGSFSTSVSATEYKRVTVTVSGPNISNISLWTILAKDFYAPNPNA